MFYFCFECFFSAIRSAFFWFCNDERGKVKAVNPEYGVGDIAKELGKKWSDVEPTVKSKYEAMAENDKKRYERVSILILRFVWFMQSYETSLPKKNRSHWRSFGSITNHPLDRQQHLKFIL